MLLEIGLVAGGVPVGWLWRKSSRAMALVNSSLTWSVRIMLCLLGLALGADENLLAQIRILGLRAACISTLSVLGCIFFGWLLVKTAFADIINAPFKSSRNSASQADSDAESATKSGLSGSLVVLSFFFAGGLIGWSGLLPTWITQSNASTWVLYFLLFAAGMSVGFDLKALGIFRELKGRILLIPLGVVAGTWLGSTLAWFILSPLIGGSYIETLAVGSGFGYYSLATVILTQMGDPSLGSVALLSNMIHEILALSLPPLMVRTAGRLAPVLTGGAAAMDTCLPVIAHYSGERCAILAVFSGMCLTMLVPVLIPALMALR